MVPGCVLSATRETKMLDYCWFKETLGFLSVTFLVVSLIDQPEKYVVHTSYVCFFFRVMSFI